MAEDILEFDAVAPVPAREDAVVELEDGSALIRNDGDSDDDDLGSVDFDANLAEKLDEAELSVLGRELVEQIEQDIQNREKRDKLYEEGIQRTGLGGQTAPGGAQFEGASRTAHPMLLKGCVDFASRAVRELMPPSGPAKIKIWGEQTEDKLARAQRKKEFMNWQLTTQVEEHRAELERVFSQLPLGGAQYKLWWWDAELKRPRTEAVYIDNVFIPYNQADFYTSPRITVRQRITAHTYARRVASGMYRDLSIAADPTDENTLAGAAADKVVGEAYDAMAYNEEGLRTCYMVFAQLEVEGDTKAGGMAPYIVHIDAHSQRVLGLYRNWKESDARKRGLNWIVEYEFIPWRSGRGIGLSHIIGGMAAAATGALRAILDAAHIENFPGGLKLAGGRTAGQSIDVQPTQLVEIASPPGVDDIRKLVMPFPFKGPSAVLYQVMEWLTQQAEIVVATASEKIADQGNNMPVGTALALIEHGSNNFSAIHARMHAAFAKELEVLHRIDAMYLDDADIEEDMGPAFVTHEDFEGPLDVQPVSDPNVFSEAQRYAQLQAVMQLRADPQFQQLFKPDKLLQRALRLIQIPAPEELANLPKEPERADALTENYLAAQTEPRPLKAFPDQDHVAHLTAHLQFMLSPIFGSSQLFGPQTMPVLMAHCREHLIEFYRFHTTAAAEAMVQVSKAQGLELTAEEAMAQGSAFADQFMAQVLSPMLAPALQQAQQKAAEFAKLQLPQPSPDVIRHTEALIQVEQIRAQSLVQSEQVKASSMLQKTQLDKMVELAKQRIELMQAQLREANDRVKDLIEGRLDLVKETGRQATELQKAQLTANVQTLGHLLGSGASADMGLVQEQIDETLAQLIDGPDAAAERQHISDNLAAMTQQMIPQEQVLGGLEQMLVQQGVQTMQQAQQLGAPPQDMPPGGPAGPQQGAPQGPAGPGGMPPGVQPGMNREQLVQALSERMLAQQPQAAPAGPVAGQPPRYEGAQNE